MVHAHAYANCRALYWNICTRMRTYDIERDVRQT